MIFLWHTINYDTVFSCLFCCWIFQFSREHFKVVSKLSSLNHHLEKFSKLFSEKAVLRILKVSSKTFTVESSLLKVTSDTDFCLWNFHNFQHSQFSEQISKTVNIRDIYYLLSHRIRGKKNIFISMSRGVRRWESRMNS